MNEVASNDSFRVRVRGLMGTSMKKAQMNSGRAIYDPVLVPRAIE
jgi:hypothetical protein